ncbi:GNAT family N-acetyltransferase [Flavobacterium sp. ENC]|uniref:GNAT family N-acetyltransferase n=1 Tax=Flavobacterium sp. ENC TaxID=2897330 RepID=UPI001E3711EF|nr:GNAT family N-acetyltransferase [Flavobacterium sp. ENC]MCD0464406.1 GNAT family N-acetyltransferase [Flavobacterium sp. ENC]
MKIIEKEVLSLQDKEVLLQLWNSEYPERLNYQTMDEFDLYLDALSEKNHYLLIDDEDKIKGWAFTFLRNDEDWFAVILNQDVQGTGKGSLLINELKKRKDSLNGWVIDHEKDVKQNKEKYKSPLLFYIKNGFVICTETRIENEKMSAVKINWKK